MLQGLSLVNTSLRFRGAAPSQVLLYAHFVSEGGIQAMYLYPRHANSRKEAYIPALSFIGKMETKMKAENRALGPQIQEWPNGPPGGATGKTCLLSRKEIAQSLHGKDRPGAWPSATPCIHPPTQSPSCVHRLDAGTLCLSS